jgi:hypothetical protein
MRPATDKLFYEVFAVGDKFYCLWDNNIPVLNAEFLKYVDHGYFNYLADLHSKELGGANKMRSAVALHTAYFHGLETLFSLIFAGLQAPRAMPAWILKCRTDQLKTLVEIANANSQQIKAQFVLKNYSWESIADFFNGIALHGNESQDTGATDLGKLWRGFAKDYVDKHSSLAYNSFKHGFRIKLGGMKIAFSPASSPETPPSERTYHELGKSDFGTSFYEPISIDGAPNINPDRHFRIRDCHVNSYPEYAVEALRLISISIHNVVSTLKTLNKITYSPGLLPDKKDWLNSLQQKKLA